jgi:hypothetical protein
MIGEAARLELMGGVEEGHRRQHGGWVGGGPCVVLLMTRNKHNTTSYCIKESFICI